MSYTAKVIAVLGRTLRAGRWKLADDSLVIAVFGRCVLDLSRAYVDEEDDDLTMSVFALFGSVSIVLPPGCDVEPSGIAFLASSEVEIPSDKTDDITHEVLAPLDISWFAMFGRVRINEVVPEPPEVEEAPSDGALAPPDATVFEGGADPGQSPDRADQRDQTDQRAGSAPASPNAGPEDDALRDEIAQWRSETGRPAPESNADTEPATEVDAAAESAEESAGS